MTNTELRRQLEGYVDKDASLFYNGKTRTGHISAVKQGPCFSKDREFTYLNSPDGACYIEWVNWTKAEGYSTAKTLKWERVTEFSLMSEPNAGAPVVKEPAPPQLGEGSVLRRGRPVLGGI